MLNEKLLTYDSDDEYLATRRLKPEIIAKYKAACSTVRRPDRERTEGKNLIRLTQIIADSLCRCQRQIYSLR